MSAATSDARARRTAGLVLVVAALYANVPFAILGARFSYPDVLRRPAEEVLARFAAAGAPLIAAWYASMIAALVLCAVVLAFRAAVGARRPALARAATVLGTLACAFQAIGLARWVFAVPRLAATFVDPASTDAERAASVVVFDTLNQYAGVAIGEHLGQMTTAAWTACAALLARGVAPFRPVDTALGLVVAAGLVVGLSDGLATVVDVSSDPLSFVTPASYVAWTLWLLVLGARLVVSARRDGRAESSPSSA